MIILYSFVAFCFNQSEIAKRNVFWCDSVYRLFILMDKELTGSEPSSSGAWYSWDQIWRQFDASSFLWDSKKCTLPYSKIFGTNFLTNSLLHNCVFQLQAVIIFKVILKHLQKKFIVFLIFPKFGWNTGKYKQDQFKGKQY